MKQKHVAILYNANHECELVLECRVVSEEELISLINQAKIKREEVNTRIAKLENKCKKLELDILLDRGEITKEEYESEVSKL